MAVAAENLAKINEVIDAINSRIRDRIRNQIVWHRGNLPPHFPSGWASRFGSYSGSLAGVSISNGSANTLAYFNNVYNGIINAFSEWSKVRRCNFTYREGYWTNSDTPGYTTYSYSQIAYLASGESAIVNSVKNRRAYVNTLLHASNFNAFLDELYNVWNSLKETYAVGGSNWTTTTCHSNCHSSCHGSGGRR